MVKLSKRKRRRKQNGGAVQEKGPDPEEKRDQRDEAKEAERGAGDKPATKGADVKAQEAEFKKKRVRQIRRALARLAENKCRCEARGQIYPSPTNWSK